MPTQPHEFKIGDRVRGYRIYANQWAAGTVIQSVPDLIVVRWDGGPEISYDERDIEDFKVTLLVRWDRRRGDSEDKS